MNTCQQMKQQLLEVGLDAVRNDPQLSDHIHSCAECTALLKAYAEVPALLDQLPEHEPSEVLLASTLDATQGSSSEKTTSPRWNRQFATAMGTAVVMLAALGLSLQFSFQQRAVAPLGDELTRLPSSYVGPQGEAEGKSQRQKAEEEAQFNDRFAKQDSASDDLMHNTTISEEDRRRALMTQQYDAADVAAYLAAENERSGGGQPAPAMVGGLTGSDSTLDLVPPERPPEERYRGSYTESPTASIGRDNDVGSATMDQEKLAAAATELSRLSAVYSPDHPDIIRVQRQIAAMQSTGSPDSSRPQQEFAADGQVASEVENKKIAHGFMVGQKNNNAESEQDPRIAAIEDIVVIAAKKPIGPAVDESHSDIQEIIVTGNRIEDFSVYDFDFLEHYQQTSALSFQSPEGYWANSYVPGDPQIRLLSARLARWDRTALGESWRLEQDVTPVRQPFDAPENNALALTLMSDANAVDGPTRMRLQVGVRGIEHLRGQRPAMNLAVVIDLPDDAGDADRIATRALLDALLSSKQSGDRFSLVMGGGLESLTIAPEDFRFGPLQLATQAILGQQPSHTGERGSLLDAVQSAAKLVKSGDDPSRPLGSSAILLISAGGLAETDALAAFVHSQARDGITFSVFPLGDRPQSADVELLVLAGLGNRRYLDSPDRARALVEEELHAASRAVARAARLAIRLAPGVHLVEVIGSHRLELPDQERVKEIETAMDQRLRTNLGIEADRGDDEDGIQIIIPSVFANDSLTVLVDVVVDKAGPIADVSLRYKDLVFKKNGTLSSHFELGDGPLNRGPSELAVLKNLLAHYFSESVQDAAEALAQDDFELAESELATALTTLTGLKGEINAWEDDPELLRDQLILARYLSVLTSPEGITHQPILADSLRYAAWAKTHQPAE